MAPDDVNAMVVGQVFARIDVKAALPRLERTFADWRPDVVLREPSEFTSALLAERAGIPCARVAVSLAVNEERALDWAAEEVESRRRELGLPADPGADRLRRSP